MLLDAIAVTIPIDGTPQRGIALEACQLLSVLDKTRVHICVDLQAVA